MALNCRAQSCCVCCGHQCKQYPLSCGSSTINAREEHWACCLLAFLLVKAIDLVHPQAEKLRSRAQKSDIWRSNQQLCRYLFYLGRIRAVQLDYTDSKDCLQQAFRKVSLYRSLLALSCVVWQRATSSKDPDLHQLHQMECYLF